MRRRAMPTFAEANYLASKASWYKLMGLFLDEFSTGDLLKFIKQTPASPELSLAWSALRLKRRRL